MLSTINKVLFYLVALFIIFPYKVSAQHQDSILISLLTCSPGNKIYTLFGHNGLRYQNLTRNIDIVFNYNSPLKFNISAKRLLPLCPIVL